MRHRLSRVLILVGLPFALLFVVFAVNKKRLNLALSEASLESQPEIVASLINRGADVNCSNGYGYTPLHEAAGASQSVGGNTKAADMNNEKVIKLLVRHGANVNAQNRDGDTPLHSAVMIQNLIATKTLVKMGARVNVESKRFGTPLRQAQRELNRNLRWHNESVPISREIVRALQGYNSRTREKR